ncbi:MAG: putative cystine transporter YijE [Legionellaceae bacterium]
MLQQNSWRSYGLLISLIIIWGINWPMMKIGIHYISPLWFCSTRLGIGSLALFLFLIISKKFRIPSREDIPNIAVIAIFQMAIYLCMINLALKQVNVGQSAILSYTSPLWVAPIAIFIFKEAISPLKIIGLIIAFIGVIILFNPFHHDWSNPQLVIGNIQLFLASICFAITILYSRFTKWHNPPLILMPWQLGLGSLLTLITAIIFEPHPTIVLGLPLTFVLFYTSIFASAFAYWSMITISKTLPAITSSLALLGVPLLGLVLATVFLHEPFTVTLGLSIGLFLLGMTLVNIADWWMMRRKLSN